MYSIMNCTPHAVQICASLVGGASRSWAVDANGYSLVPSVRRVGQALEALVVPPSGFRLACEAITHGPDMGCSVTYQLSEEARAEKPRIWDCFADMPDSEMLVIASEISVRTLNGSLYDPGVGLPIVAMWPVLASESLRFPMSERWADRLATLYRPVHNDAGEVVGEVAAHQEPE